MSHAESVRVRVRPAPEAYPESIDRNRDIGHRQPVGVFPGGNTRMAGGAEAAFWNVERIDDLCAALQDVSRAVNRSPRVLAEYLQGLAPERVLPDETGLRRLLTGRTRRPRNPERLDGLLAALPVAYEHDDTRTYDLATRQRLMALVVQRERAGHPPPAMAAPVDGETTQFLRTLARFLGSTASEFSKVKDLFFDDQDPAGEPLRYLMYRWDTRPGRILKTFLELHPPAADREMCVFTHYAKLPPKRKVRQASGLVLPFGGTLSLIGRVADSAGLKVMTLPRPNGPQDRYNGLLMSFDERDAPIAARFVMVRTAVRSAEEAGLDSFPEAKISGEVDGFKAELSNAVHIRLDRAILRNGQPIDHRDLAALVQDRLQAAGDRLTDADGRAYNPAVLDADMFDSALRIFMG